MRKTLELKGINDVLDNVGRLLKQRFEKKGYRALMSSHEILGGVGEEYRELQDAVKSNHIENVRDELLDLIVAALWGVVSIDQNTLDW